MALGLDYSYSHPDPGCARAAGYEFVARYIGDPDPNSAKYLDAAELAATRAAGLSVVVVRETTAGFMINEDGGAHARASRAHCNALGLNGIPVYYALDVDPRGLSAGQRGAVTQFLASAAAADGGGQNVGIYGSDDALDWFMGDTCHWGWQTYAWSGGRISPKAHFRQYKNGASVCGATVDLNVSYAADFGQWPRPNVVPTPVPSLEDLMPFPVIAAPAGSTGVRPWKALLPGKVIYFVDWDPLPESTPDVQWAPGWAYYAGVEVGFLLPVEPASSEAVYDQAGALATQYSRLPTSAVTQVDVDEAAVAAAVLAVLTPEAIAGAIPAGLAEAVADELRDRLAS